jgi:hypothetical protein
MLYEPADYFVTTWFPAISLANGNSIVIEVVAGLFADDNGIEVDPVGETKPVTRLLTASRKVVAVHKSATYPKVKVEFSHDAEHWGRSWGLAVALSDHFARAHGSGGQLAVAVVATGLLDAGRVLPVGYFSKKLRAVMEFATERSGERVIYLVPEPPPDDHAGQQELVDARHRAARCQNLRLVPVATLNAAIAACTEPVAHRRGLPVLATLASAAILLMVPSDMLAIEATFPPPAARRHALSEFTAAVRESSETARSALATPVVDGSAAQSPEERTSPSAARTSGLAEPALTSPPAQPLSSDGPPELGSSSFVGTQPVLSSPLAHE